MRKIADLLEHYRVQLKANKGDLEIWLLLATLAGAVATILFGVSAWLEAAILLVLAAVFALRVIVRYRPDWWVERPRFSIRIPCSAQSFNEYLALLERVFPGRATPSGALAAARPRNPYNVVTVRDTERVIGGLELYSIADESFDKLIEGSISEAELMTEDLVGVKEGIASGRLYCAITIEPEASPYVTGWAGESLLSAAGLVLKAVYLDNMDGKDIVLYASGASDPGKRLLARLGFQKIRSAQDRKDGFPMYRLVASRNGLDEFRLNYPVVPRHSSVLFHDRRQPPSTLDQDR